MIEINQRAKKVEWGDKILTPAEGVQHLLAGKYLMIFSASKENPELEHTYDAAPSNNELDEAWFAKYLNKGFVIRPSLLKKVVVYQHIVRNTMFGTIFGTVYAKSRRDLDHEIMDMGNSVVERFTPVSWKPILNNVDF
jgi:hypothetical protein